MNREYESIDYAIEVIATILLALATVASAWCAYQSTRWSGVQANALSESNLINTQSVTEFTRADQLATIDVGMFVQYIAATAQKDKKLADFIAQRFRPEMNKAFKAWLATNPMNNPKAPSSPFIMPEYKSKARDYAQSLVEKARRTFDYAKNANQQADEYVLLTVLFTSVLFFSGLSTTVKKRHLRWTLLIIGAIVFVFGIIVLSSYPIE